MGHWKELLIVLAVVSLGAWWMQVEPPPLSESVAVSTPGPKESPMVPLEAGDWVRSPRVADKPGEFAFANTRLLLKLRRDDQAISLQCLEAKTGKPADIPDLYFDDVHLLAEFSGGEKKTIPLEMVDPTGGHWTLEQLALGNQVTSLQIEATPGKRQPPEVRVIVEIYPPVKSNSVRVQP